MTFQDYVSLEKVMAAWYNSDKYWSADHQAW